MASEPDRAAGLERSASGRVRGVPANPLDPIPGGSEVSVLLSPGGEMAFDVPELGPVIPGAAFQLDEPSEALITSIPVDGSAITLGCAGRGGRCGEAEATLVRLTTSDGRTAGLTPFAMPPPLRQYLEIQCVIEAGDGTIAMPEEIVALMARAQETSPITRIRTAYMREGTARGVNRGLLPPNQVFLAVGHGVLGFTSF
jgi:hypothetical protein